MMYKAIEVEKIKVSPEATRHLMRVFNCTAAVVSLALDGTRDNDTSRKIRHVAMTQLGGIKVQDVKWVKSK